MLPPGAAMGRLIVTLGLRDVTVPSPRRLSVTLPHSHLSGLGHLVTEPWGGRLRAARQRVPWHRMCLAEGEAQDTRFLLRDNTVGLSQERYCSRIRKERQTLRGKSVS